MLNSNHSKMLERRRAARWIAAAIVVLAMVPFNMGGCASDGDSGGGGSGGGLGLGSIGQAVGGAVGGRTGTYISAGSKAASAAAMSEADEDAIGQSVAINITNRHGLDADESLNRYITLVGLTVASATSRPDGNYVFGVLNTDEVNAYAGPNGYIMITRGAIRRMRDESELAGVLGHEIAHVTQRHGLSAAQRAGFAEAGMEVARTNEDIARFGALSDNVIDLIVNKGYGREQELEADLAAVKFVSEAGYDPAGYHRFLQRMAAEAGNSGRPTVLSTHPGLDQRVERVSKAIEAQGRAGGATLADRFKANVKIAG